MQIRAILAACLPAIADNEVLKLEAQIQHIMDARQKSLGQTRPIIINR